MDEKQAPQANALLSSPVSAPYFDSPPTLVFCSKPPRGRFKAPGVDTGIYLHFFRAKTAVGRLSP